MTYLKTGIKIFAAMVDSASIRILWMFVLGLVLVSLTKVSYSTEPSLNSAAALPNETLKLPSEKPAILKRFQVGDDLFKQRRDGKKALAALDFFRKELIQTPNDPEAMWRVAIVTYFLGNRKVVSDTDELKKLYTEGRDISMKCLEVAPNYVPCHFWGAINMVLYAETVGVVKMLFSLGKVREHLQRAIALDPTFMGGGAYRLEATIEEKLPGILGGSYDRAREFYEKSIQYGQQEPLNYFAYARLLLKEFQDSERALEVARSGLEVDAPTPERIEAIDAIRDLKEFFRLYARKPTEDSES